MRVVSKAESLGYLTTWRFGGKNHEYVKGAKKRQLETPGNTKNSI